MIYLQATLQYCVIKPIMAVITLILQPLGYYSDGDWRYSHVLFITVILLLSPLGALFISSPVEEELNRDSWLIRVEDGGEGRLFNLDTTMVSVLHKELEYKVEVGGSSSIRSWRSWSRGSESNPNFQLVNKPSWISPHKVLQLWLINTVYHLLLKND